MAALTYDGELRVLGPDPELTRSAGQAMEAHLFSDNRILTLMLDGSVEQFGPSESRAVVGKIDRPWAHGLAVGPDQVLVANASELAILTPSGLGRRWPMPERAVGVRPIGAGGGFVVATTHGAFRFGLAEDAPTALPAPHLDPFEQVSEALLHEGTLYLSTDRGRLLALDPDSGQQHHATTLGVSGRIELGPAESGLVALTPDGVLRRFDSALAPVQSLWLGSVHQLASERALMYSPGKPALLIRSATRGVVVDGPTMTIRQRLPLLSDSGTVTLSTDGASALTFERFVRVGSGEQGGRDIASDLWATSARNGTAPVLADGERDRLATIVLSPLCEDCG